MAEITNEPATLLMPGAVADGSDEESMERAKKVLHDRVVEQLGDWRTSGVTWRIYEGPEAIETVTDIFAHPSGTTIGDPGALDGLVAFLKTNPTAQLIIASAEYVEPHGARRG